MGKLPVFFRTFSGNSPDPWGINSPWSWGPFGGPKGPKNPLRRGVGGNPPALGGPRVPKGPMWCGRLVGPGGRDSGRHVGPFRGRSDGRFYMTGIKKNAYFDLIIMEEHHLFLKNHSFRIDFRVCLFYLYLIHHYYKNFPFLYYFDKI